MAGKKVFEVRGMKSTLRFLKNTGEEKLDKASDAIHKAGFFLESEIKASIGGERAETKSVDTGQFRGSVKTNNTKFLQSEVSSDVKQAVFMEKGTSRGIKPRHHFENSSDRNKGKIASFIKKAIK